MAKKRGAVETACCVPAIADLGEEEAERLAHAFAALGDPARVRVLALLGSAGGGEVCNCELVEPLGKSQPTVSHHLKVLAAAGLVVGEKRGRWVWYRLVPERLEELRTALELRGSSNGARRRGRS